MSFEEYCKIMKEHGIGELLFLYEGKRCSISIEILDFSLQYNIQLGYKSYCFENFDEMVSTKYLATGKDLKEMWDGIEILSIDGFSDDEYDANACSFDYVKYIEEQGELQYSYNHSAAKSLFMRLRYAVLGVLILPILSILFPLLGEGNWNIVLLTGIVAVISIMVIIIVMLKNRIIIGYNITTKKIFAFNGFDFVTGYDNIKKIKLKKSIFKKGYGTIKIYVKRGLSINYHIRSIPNAEAVYNLINENIEKNKEENTAVL